MRPTVSVPAVALLAVAGIALVLAEGSSGDTEKAVAALEQTWSDAQLANNLALSRPLFADTMILTDAEGQMRDRDAFLAAEKNTHYTSSEVTGLKVHAYGNAAVARYTLHQKYTVNGKASDDLTRETDTWVKSASGAWQLVAAHGSKVRQP